MPSSRHVLLVDDHPEVRAVLAHLVAQLCPDATITEAAHGAEALSVAAQQHPDLIITDYHMPIMGGLELVRTLRAQGTTMPILVLSSDISVAEAILAAGATAFLPKPFRVRALRELLPTLLPTDEETQAVGE
jgi:CheY-like chemotaxis protein